MITKKNYIILAVIIAVFVMAYVGLLSLFGFSQHWQWPRLSCFILLTYVIIASPLFLIMKVWGDIEAKREKAYQEMKAKRTQQ